MGFGAVGGVNPDNQTLETSSGGVLRFKDGGLSADVGGRAKMAAAFFSADQGGRAKFSLRTITPNLQLPDHIIFDFKDSTPANILTAIEAGTLTPLGNFLRAENISAAYTSYITKRTLRANFTDATKLSVLMRVKYTAPEQFIYFGLIANATGDGAWFNRAAGGQWSVNNNDNTTTTSTNISAYAESTVYDFLIELTSANVKFYSKLPSTDTFALLATHTTNLPRNTIDLGFKFRHGGTPIKSIDIYSVVAWFE